MTDENKTVANFKIRPAKPEDCDSIADLILQLAIYEKCPDDAKLTGSDLRRDGFERNPPLFFSKVAEIFENNEPKVVAFILYYFRYSTWNGKAMYLEDFYVEEKYRSLGIGSELFKSLAEECNTLNCCSLDFVVLDWNEPSKKFYENRGAANISNTEDWRLYRLHKPELENLQKN